MCTAFCGDGGSLGIPLKVCNPSMQGRIATAAEQECWIGLDSLTVILIAACIDLLTLLPLILGYCDRLMDKTDVDIAEDTSLDSTLMSK